MELSASIRRVIPSPVLTRAEFALAVFVVALINANIARMADAILAIGPLPALAQGFGVSWVVWCAAALCIGIALKARPEPLRRADGMMGGLCLALIFWPTERLSMLAVTLLALHLFLVRPKDDHLRAAAMVMAAIAVNGLWTDVLLLFIAEPLLAFDAHLVGWAMDVPVQGNVLILSESGAGLTIGMQCSFVANASLALLLWIAVTRAFRPVPIRSELYYGAAIFAAVIAVNTIRISFMTLDPYWIVLFHGNVGAQYISLATMALTLVVAAIGIRRELAR